jgi:hypothetical protein
VRADKAVHQLGTAGTAPVVRVVSDGDVVAFALSTGTYQVSDTLKKCTPAPVLLSNRCPFSDRSRTDTTAAFTGGQQALCVAGDRSVALVPGGAALSQWRTAAHTHVAGPFACVSLDQAKFVTGGSDNNVNVFRASDGQRLLVRARACACRVWRWADGGAVARR